MKRRTCLIVSAIALFALAIVSGASLFIGGKAGDYFLNRQVDVDSAIESALEWGRLAPFPESTGDIEVTTGGSMFTRAFRVTFQASLDDIEQWIENSPGLRECTVEIVDENTTEYMIEPRGGAAYAEVAITVLDGEMGLVEVYTYWS